MENQKELTPEEKLSSAITVMLKWKQDYGAEVSYSSQMQAIAMQAEGKVKELQAQVDDLNKKIDEMTEKLKDKNKD